MTPHLLHQIPIINSTIQSNPTSTYLGTHTHNRNPHHKPNKYSHSRTPSRIRHQPIKKERYRENHGKSPRNRIANTIKLQEKIAFIDERVYILAMV